MSFITAGRRALDSELSVSFPARDCSAAAGNEGRMSTGEAEGREEEGGAPTHSGAPFSTCEPPSASNQAFNDDPQ